MKNYRIECEKIIDRLQKEEKVPTLLLHSCCAPCSSYCLEYLSEYFHVTVFYYNPNIYPEEEYAHRVAQQKQLISQMKFKYPVSFIEGDFKPEDFYSAVKGLENLGECSERCFACYSLRLKETAKTAKEKGFDFFTTTLSISPLKRAEKINEIGEIFETKTGVSFLPSDFKKRDGFKRSIQLSAEYGLYRQNYCGCIFSRQERKNEVESK